MSELDRDTLMAYLDDQLDADMRARVEADPGAMAELALLQRQADAIRTLYAPAGAEPVPSRLDPHRLALKAQRRRWRSVAQAAVIVATLAIGIAAGWLLRPATDAPALYDRLIADAVSAHTVYVAENRHAVEVAGGDAEHLSSWLSNRLDTALAMPDLSAEGLTFLGGRLLPAPAVPGGRAAQLMYEDAAGARTTLYITPAQGVGGPDYETVSFGSDTALYWQNAVFTCTIVGPRSGDALRAIAAEVFGQLSPERVSPAYRS
jgi:anti-sigma factor RsiW